MLGPPTFKRPRRLRTTVASTKRSTDRLVSGATVVIVTILMTGAFSGCLGIERTEWAYQVTQIDALQDEGLGGKGIVIGIVDSGIDPGHASLRHIPIAAWRDYINDRDEPYDDVGHGTHVAGIIAAKGGSQSFLSGADLKGVAPRVSLVVVKACGPEMCTSEGVARGIDFAAGQGVDILTLSLGGRQTVLDLGDAPLEAVNRAVGKGIFVVAAAGNSGTEHGDVESPSSARGAIAVGAVDENLHVADFSSRGSQSKNQGSVAGIGAREHPNKKPELVAPGVDILSAWKDDTYAKASGTSQATPFVAGTIALLLESEPRFRPGGSKGGSSETVFQMKSVLTESAKKVPGQATPHDRAAGYGLVQAERALTRLQGL